VPLASLTPEPIAADVGNQEVDPAIVVMELLQRLLLVERFKVRYL
jgi:hypothetical protein